MLSQKIQDIKELEEQEQKIKSERQKIEQYFLDKIVQLHKIGHSVAKKINLSSDLQKKVFTKDLSFLSLDHYKISSLSKSSNFNISAYGEKIEFHYLVYKITPDSFAIPTSFFFMSDREFASLVRKHIRQEKNIHQETYRANLMNELSKNEKEITKLLNENYQIKNVLQKIRKEQNDRANKIEEEMIKKSKQRTS